MKNYAVLLRGINVGGKNKVPMASLRTCLEELGFTNVATYIASGNVVLQSNKRASEIKSCIETALPEYFTLDSKLIAVLVLSLEQLQLVVDNKPQGFGDSPGLYHSDAIFLIDTDIDTAMAVFDPRAGIDMIWPGTGVIYSQRLSAERAKSRLGKIIGTPAYKSMTIRNWNTTTKLLTLLKERENV